MTCSTVRQACDSDVTRCTMLKFSLSGNHHPSSARPFFSPTFEPTFESRKVAQKRRNRGERKEGGAGNAAGKVNLNDGAMMASGGLERFVFLKLPSLPFFSLWCGGGVTVRVGPSSRRVSFRTFISKTKYTIQVRSRQTDRVPRPVHHASCIRPFLRQVQAQAAQARPSIQFNSRLVVPKTQTQKAPPPPLPYIFTGGSDL